MSSGSLHGKIFGKYRVTRRLAGGGMGEVYLARHEIMAGEAVVKVLLPAMSGRTAMVKRFFAEARAAAAISHPGIVRIFDVGYANDGRAYLVMEKLEGETLRDRITRDDHLDNDTTRLLMIQLARAVGAAHACGIVHRDLKPNNVFVVPDPDIPGGERIKVLDFGLAKLVGERGAGLTRTGQIFGTPAYMAPEQCTDAGAVDHRADLYALGCILYACLCGRPPFGRGGIELVAAHLRDTPTPPSLVQPSVSRDLDTIAVQLLQKRPEDRFQTCKELVAMLELQVDEHARTGLFEPVSDGDMTTSRMAVEDLGPTDRVAIAERVTDRVAIAERVTDRVAIADDSTDRLAVSPESMSVAVAGGESIDREVTDPDDHDGGDPGMLVTSVVPGNVVDDDRVPTLKRRRNGVGRPAQRESAQPREREEEEIEEQPSSEPPVPPRALAVVRVQRDEAKGRRRGWLAVVMLGCIAAGAAAIATFVAGAAETDESRGDGSGEKAPDTPSLRRPGGAAKPVADSIARANASARKAIGREDWSGARRSARRALELDPGNEIATKWLAQAEREQANGERFDELTRAVASDDYRAVARHFAGIEFDSVYRDRARGDRDRALHRYCNGQVAMAKKLASAGRCDEIARLMERVAGLWNEGACSLDSVATRCASPAAGLATAGRRRRGNDRRAGRERDKAARSRPAGPSYHDLVDGMERHASTGAFGAALKACSDAYSTKASQDLIGKCGLFACKIGNTSQAKRFYRLGDSVRKGQIKQFCLKFGNEIDLDVTLTPEPWLSP